jgi:hypothetical protein
VALCLGISSTSRSRTTLLRGASARIADRASDRQEILARDSHANRLNQLKRGTCDLAFVLPHEVGLELDSKRVKPVKYLLVATSKWKNRA